MSDINQEDDEDFVINPDNVIQVIELDDDGNAHATPGPADNDVDDEVEYDDDGMETGEDGASSGPVQDDSQLSFPGHKDSSVICCRVSPANSEQVVTGGQDDQALVWNSQDGSVYFQCTGHTDTVVSVGFSHDGALVATADMKGLVQVWKVDSGQMVWNFEVSELEWIQWHPAAPVLLGATKDGHVWMWKVPAGDYKTLPGFGPSALCGRILPDGKRVCVGYEDGAVKIWDLKSAEALHSISGHEGHKEAVFCLDHTTDGSLIASGSGDMTARVVNTASGKVVCTLPCQQSAQEAEDSVECVGFAKTQEYLATGTLTGSLEVWDLPSKTRRHQWSHPDGVVRLQWSAHSPLLYTACLDGNLRAFDGRSGQLVRTWHGHTENILDFDLARDETILVTASDDSTAKVFSLKS